ncbi:MAG: AAA family ATPase [Gallionellaceae bacterium]|nr:AAA family ATPase [Gallionellaceae bacterium]
MPPPTARAEAPSRPAAASVIPPPPPVLAQLPIAPPVARSKADWARELYSAGWRAFPVIENGKTPMWAGWQRSSQARTLAELAASPGANIGAVPPPDCFVLDVDGEVGRATLEAFELMSGSLPATLEAQTQSGGRHLVFSLPPSVTVPNAVRFAPGLDARMSGKGFIVVEPSTIDGRAYRWQNWETPIVPAPRWLIAAIKAGKSEKPQAESKTLAEPDSPIPEGMRNDTLAGKAGKMRNAGFDEHEIIAALSSMNDRRCAPPLPPEELATIAQSVARYPAAPESWQVGFGQSPLPPGALEILPQRFQLLTATELAALPSIRWRVRGVIPSDGIGALYGPSGSGKSFLALDMLAAISTGREWFSCRVKAAPVVYVGLEGEAGIAQRAHAYRAEHGALSDNFRFLLSPLDIREPKDHAELVKAIKATDHAGGVLVLDTLNRAAPGMDENDSRDMGQVITAAKALQAELGGLVLLVHHTGKDGTKGLRGHSSLHAALDCAIEVRREGDRREWLIAKAKDGGDGESYPFRLDVVELGADGDGEPITSCVVTPEERTKDATRSKLPKGGNQRIVWDALGELLRESKNFSKGGAPLARPCVELEAAITAITPRLTCEEKRKPERTRQAITALLANKNIEHREGWIWLP